MAILAQSAVIYCAVMDSFSLVFVALSLSVDCFAVAISGSISLRTSSFLKAFRTSFAFGFAQFLMPVLGWLAGRTVVEFISSYDHWVAFGLLGAIGGKMVWESFRGEGDREKTTDITRGFLLITLAVATSLDALAVGLSFAFLQVDILSASGTIGGVAFVVTAAGFYLGRRVSGMFGKAARLIGGLVLVGIGVRIVLAHVL